MSTDAIRDAADDMDIDGFVPDYWLVIAQNRGGDTVTVWRTGTGAIDMLARATASVRERNGAPGRTQ